MKIAVVKEADAEPRVALTPDVFKKRVGLGAEISAKWGAGLRSGVTDAAEAGARVAGP